MRKGRNNIVAGLIVLMAGGVWVIAQEKKDQPAGAGPTAEQAAMMEAWMKAGTPGAQHDKLKMLAGKFDAEVTMQMDPNAPAEKSKGTETNKTLFDGRYLHSEYSGTMMGQPFKGMGLYGFDNVKQKYVMTWVDSMSTMINFAEGTADDAGKTITFKSECECPGTKDKMAMRQVLMIEDTDHHTYESYTTGKDGKEIKVMSIKFTRSAGA